MTEQHDSLATGLVRIEGKLDVFTEKISNLQEAVSDLRRAHRDAAASFENALRDHITDVNPHPAQEMWLRDINKRQDERADELARKIGELEAEQMSRRAVVGFSLGLVTICLSFAGVLAAYIH